MADDAHGTTDTGSESHPRRLSPVSPEPTRVGAVWRAGVSVRVAIRDFGAVRDVPAEDDPGGEAS